MPSMACGLDQRRGEHRGEAGLGGLRDRRVDQGELQQRADAGQVVEARAGDLGAALDVDGAEQLAELQVVLGLEALGGEVAGGADASPGRRSPPRRRPGRRGGRGCRAASSSRWVSSSASCCSASAALTSAASSLGLLQQLGLLVARRPWGSACRATSARSAARRSGRRTTCAARRRRAGRRRGATSSPRARWEARTRSGSSRSRRRSITPPRLPVRAPALDSIFRMRRSACFVRNE